MRRRSGWCQPLIISAPQPVNSFSASCVTNSRTAGDERATEDCGAINTQLCVPSNRRDPGMSNKVSIESLPSLAAWENHTGTARQKAFSELGRQWQPLFNLLSKGYF